MFEIIATKTTLARFGFFFFQESRLLRRESAARIIDDDESRYALETVRAEALVPFDGCHLKAIASHTRAHMSAADGG